MKQIVRRRAQLGRNARGSSTHQTVFQLAPPPQVSVDVYGAEPPEGSFWLVSEPQDVEIELEQKKKTDRWWSYSFGGFLPVAAEYQVVFKPANGEPVVLSGVSYTATQLLDLADTQGGLPVEVLLPLSFDESRYARIAPNASATPEQSADAQPTGETGLTPQSVGASADDPLWTDAAEAGRYVYLFRRIGEESATGFLELVPAEAGGFERGRAEAPPFTLFEGGQDRGRRVWVNAPASQFGTPPGAKIEAFLFFWLSEVPLPESQITQIREHLAEGDAHYLTPFGVTRTPHRLGPDGVDVAPGGYSVSNRDTLRADGRPDMFNVFLTGVRASVRHLVEAYKAALDKRDAWTTQAAPSAMLAGLVYEPTTGDRRYLQDRLRGTLGADMDTAWSAAPAPEPATAPTEPPPELPAESPDWSLIVPRGLIAISDGPVVARPELPRTTPRPLPNSPTALGQWRYGHARQTQALNLEVEAAAAALICLLNSSVVRQTERDLAALDAGDDTPEPIASLIDAHAEAFVRLPESDLGLRYIRSLYGASRWAQAFEETPEDPFSAYHDDDGGTDRLKLLFKLTRKSVRSGFKVLGATVAVLPYNALGDRAAGLIARLTTSALGLGTSQEWVLHRAPVMVQLDDGVTIGRAQVTTRVVSPAGMLDRSFGQYTAVSLGDTSPAVRRALALKLPVTAILEIANIGIAASKVSSKPGGAGAAEWLGLAKAVGSGLALVNDEYGEQAWRVATGGDDAARVAQRATKQFLRVGGVVLEVVLGVRKTAQSAAAGEGLGAVGNALWTVGSVTVSMSSSGGVLVVAGGLAVTSVMLLGAAFLAAAGLFLYAQHHVNVREERESDPLWSWLYGKCVWGKGYYQAAGAQFIDMLEAPAGVTSGYGLPRPSGSNVISDALAGRGGSVAGEVAGGVAADMAPIFALVRPGWTPGAGPDDALDDRQRDQAVAFAHTAYRLRTRLSADKRRDHVMARQRSRTEPHYSVHGLWLDVVPEWAPSVGVIHVATVVTPMLDGGPTGLSVARRSCIIHYARPSSGLRYAVTSDSGTPPAAEEWESADGGSIRVWLHDGGVPSVGSALRHGSVRVPNLAPILALRDDLVVRGGSARRARDGGETGTTVYGPWFEATATVTFDALQTLDPAGAAAARAAGFSPPEEADKVYDLLFPVHLHRFDGFR